MQASPLDAYRGPRRFGRAYAAMMAADVHAAGSVDRWLHARMVWLCPETAPLLYAAPAGGGSGYRPGSRPALQALLAAHGAPEQAWDGAAPGAVLRAVVSACAGVVRAAEARAVPLDALRFGGTEEEIAARGSDWCTDVARLACRLCQVAGLPARLVALADTAAAYSGHAIIEAWRQGAWGAVDATHAVIYRRRDGRPATTWELMRDAALVRRHRRPDGRPGPAPGQFRAAAVAGYPWDAPGTYRISAVDAYTRSILEMADRGWPGGLRWLHGEDGP